MKVLIVDDNRVNLRVLERLTKMIKVQSDTAMDGQAGLNKLLTNKYDCIFVDVHMPVINGLNMIEQFNNVKDDEYQPRIYMFTADDTAQVKKRARELGVSGWITKPVDTDEVISLLKS